MMADAQWGLAEPFDIDNGELDGLTPQHCFALGVEWQMFRTKLDSGEPFTGMVHAVNAKRLAEMAIRKGRFCEDRSKHPGWTELVVGGAKRSPRE